MSHVATYKTTLTDVNHELFKAAVKEVIAAHEGYTEGNTIYNYVMEDPRKVDISIHYGGQASLKCGVGFKFTEDGLSVVGDPYNKPKKFDEIKQDVTNLYTAMATEASFAAMGYSTERKQLDSGEWMVEGYQEEEGFESEFA